ncbi:MAG TPA: DUF975 family protein [Candidatus Mediterraneibacter cottocaccae]|nr:DUF975 family protein [Candidatus Mediterraneibacter cottocaccae]
MWTRKALKKKSRTAIKKNYFKLISVCFLIAVLTTAYPVSTTFFGYQTSVPEKGATDAPFAPDISNSQVAEEMVSNFLDGTILDRLIGSSPVDPGSFLIDLYTSGTSFFFSVLRTINTFVTEDIGFSAVFLLSGVVLSFLYLIFVNNILQVGEKRFFLELHNYRNTPLSKIFFLYQLRCFIHPAWVMFCRSFFQFLWNLTVIGGFIKHYEYSLIPYILAENPKIRRKDAFFLSRQLTQHNKWKMFLLDLSFTGWEILSLCTLGAADLLFVNPYMTGCRAQLYLTLRRNYVLSRSPGFENLSDSYLEHVPTEDELLISKALYDDSRGPYSRITQFEPEQYPMFLFSVQPPSRAVHSPLKAGRKYSFLSYVFLFHAFSIFGWVLEALTSLLQSGTLPDTNFMSGPWLPLYGVCAVLLLAVIRHFLDKPVLVFLMNFCLYTVGEYTMNWLFELGLGLHLRNYSEYFLNLGGRVYLGGSVSFALLGCAFLYYLAPRWNEWFLKLTHTKRVLLTTLLTLLFAADLAVSLWLRL